MARPTMRRARWTSCGRSGSCASRSASGYDFARHIARTAYAEVSPPQRQMLHRRIAQALESRHARDLDPVRGQIAAHLERAGLPGQAISHYRAAALVAQRVYATDDATAMLIRCLTLLGQLPSSAVTTHRNWTCNLRWRRFVAFPGLDRAGVGRCARPRARPVMTDRRRRAAPATALWLAVALRGAGGLDRVGRIDDEIAALHPRQKGRFRRSRR
ncbi:MAG: hypothetical protein U0232_23160 [Thermomicrobiales bacterium]